MTEQNPKQVKEDLEFQICKLDVLYFLNDFYHIPVIGVGPRLFSLRDFQAKFINRIKFNDFLIAHKARQIGLTTLVAAYVLWDAMFNENHPWLLVSRNQDAATKILDRIWYAWTKLPSWMIRRLPKITAKSQTLMKFDNGSYIESIPATADTGRGDSVYGVVLDEFAYMQYAVQIYAALSPLVYGKMFVFSSAFGMGNEFFNMWIDAAVEGSIWQRDFYGWRSVPERDDDWYADRIAEFRGQPWILHQEHPDSSEEAFIGSGRMVFGPELTEDQPFSDDYVQYEWQYQRGFMEQSGNLAFPLKVWEHPTVQLNADGTVLQAPNYVIGVDPSEGLEYGDFTSIHVMDSNTGMEVATAYGVFPVEDLKYFLYDLGRWYHWALMSVERNNHGMVVIPGLVELHYPRMYRSISLGTARAGRSVDYGWVTSSKTKPKMINELVEAFRYGTIGLRDNVFVIEAQTFVRDAVGRYGGSPGFKDDHIMGLAVAWQAALDVGEYPLVWQAPDAGYLTFDQVFGLNQWVEEEEVGIGQGASVQPRMGFFVDANGRVK